MHTFISAGEPSGDLHGASLTRELKRRQPDTRVSGFGGPRMTEAGCELRYPLCDLAVMGVKQVLANLRSFVRILNDAERFLRKEKPDAVVLIDYPGFNWELAKRAKKLGIPVVYFVPPQIWSWATWRVRKMRRLTDRVLSTLPFEHEWLTQRGVNSEWIGHPYFDDLARQRPDETFISSVKQEGKTVALLPGSRRGEITTNLPMMVNAARCILARRPDTRFLLAALNEQKAELARQLIGDSDLPIEIHAGRTPEIIEAADACISVSGSVSLELMYRLKPTVIVYRIHRSGELFVKWFLRTKFITLVNLLAGRELFPEVLSRHDESERIAGQVLEWLDEPAKRDAVVSELRELREQVAVPGACARAAEAILSLKSSPAGRSAA